MSKESRELPFLVVGRDSFGQPAEVLLTASDVSEAETKARSLARKGALRNQFGREIQGPFRAKKVTWEFVDRYLETAEERYPTLFMLGDAHEAKRILREGETWYSGWETASRTDQPPPERPAIPIEERLIFTLPSIVSARTGTNGHDDDDDRPTKEVRR